LTIKSSSTVSKFKDWFFYQLCGNIFLNRLENIFPYHCAVGGDDSEIEIPKIFDYSACTNVGAFSINKTVVASNRYDFQQHLLRGKEVVQLRRLDSLQLPEAGLIKIDVEGHELEVLRGGVELLRRSGYPPILFEMWDTETHPWYAGAREDLLGFLASLGYSKIERISPLEINYLAQHPANADMKIEFERNPQGILVNIIIWAKSE